jgi:hypothetical protein
MTDATMAVDTSAMAKRDPARKPADGVDAELVGRLVEQARAATTVPNGATPPPGAPRSCCHPTAAIC